MQPSRRHQVRIRHRRFLIVHLAWSLGLLAARAAYAEPSGSPSRILQKGQWEMELGGSGLSQRTMKGGAKVTVYAGSHARGYGLTNRISIYGKIGAAYARTDDSSIPTNISNSFGTNLILGGQLNANLWRTATGSWEVDGSVGYLYMGSPHKRNKNQMNWNEWQLTTSVARSLGHLKPYAGIKLSVPHIDYQLRTDKVTTHARYQPKGIVGPLLGIDWSFGEDQLTLLNLEGSYIGGAEVDLVLTKKF